jgi:predicted HTH transcriptional regulator
MQNIDYTEISKYAVALANTKGGRIYVGVNDKTRELIGLGSI